ncbi:unnamed protein product [Urochloa humidicola]
MDVLGTLAVRFHFNGEFVTTQKGLFYCGGRVEVSYIDRDKVSLPEIMGHLRDHCNVQAGALLHWLFPGRQLHNGLRVLVDDKTCIEMSDTIVEGGVAEIYVEAPEVELYDVQEDEQQKAVAEASSQPSVALVPFCQESGVDNQKEAQPHEEVNISSDNDSDYLKGDDSSSGEDDEAEEIMRNFKQFKNKLKAGEAANLDDVILGTLKEVGNMYELEDDGNATSYEDTDGEEDSVEELSDGKVVTKSKAYPRYNSKEASPTFELGMKFSGKRQFKKAVTKHGLVERRFIRFIKNEADRCIAKCDWATCEWRCMASVNSRSSSWQIASLNGVHTCPPRRDNKLVTAPRIAKKYEKMIIANPTWSIEAMKTTVQEEMFADVHDSKLKRAKSMVMQKALDATKGQYKMLYNYQLELLRSNPGSIVVVRKDPNLKDLVFQRMYICLDALRKGFLAGCRKVVGLDGCFFKGATNGELLCAIGRDANNQMYPIAWAVVEKENNDSWDWFCDLLFRDLVVGDGDE